jgi:multidrug efflux pump subunit AcrA (membrane-fusion protein)
MNKIILITIALASTIFAMQIPTKHAQMKEFGKSIELNAQVVQLSNSKQSIMSLVSGQIKEYYIKVGQNVKKGQKIVLIESMMLSNMTANFISQKKQLEAQEKNYQASKSLYEKGMASMQELNSQSIKKDEILAKLTSLQSQLNTLGIDANKLKKPSANFILYAHSNGVVSDILQALHSSIKEDSPLISVMQNQAYYLKSFLPIKYASKVKVGQKIAIKTETKTIISKVTQILPNVDEKTQRIVLLSSIDEITNELFINAYISASLYLDTNIQYVAVEKSALSFFNNEWVVFVPKSHEDEHKKEEAHEEHAQHDEYKHEEEAHKGHGHNEDVHEEEASYEPRVVKIMYENEKFVALKGLELNEEYVSDKSYYVKTQLLKSSLGGHGH